MKNFKLFKLLLLGVVLITSIPQVRAWTFDYPYIWFCNTSATDWGSNVMFFYYYHGSDEGSEGFNMKNASHTKLWYVHVEHNRGTSLSGFKYGFIATKDWGYESGDTWSSRWTYACSKFNHSGDSQTNLDYATFLCTSSGSDNLSVSRLAAGESWASLNKSQTVKKYTRGDGAGSYTAASVASGTVTISAYKITGAGTASNSGNSATISAAATTSASRDAAYTGEVTVTATANTGYVFMGWYGSENGTDKLSSNSSYTYNAPNSAKTVYARFAEKLTVGKTLYLATNAKWRENSAKFEAVFCNATTQQWVNCTAVAGTDDMYSVNVPSGDWGCVIFVRMNPSGTAHDWSGKWCQTDDMYKSGLNNCVYITGDCSNSQRWGKYAPLPAIVGSMNNWDPIANQFTDGQLVLNNLSANSGYQFKVALGRDDYWYGYGGADNTQTYVGQTTAIALTAGNSNMAIATAGTGNYTFKWNSSEHTLKVEFPSVEHPSTDYVYVKPYSDWNPVNAHLWGGTYGTVYTYDPALSTVTIYGNDYYYTSLGNHNKIAFGQGVSDGHKTESLGEGGHASDAPTSHKGMFYDASGAYAGWAWTDFTATLALDHQGATNTPAPNNITVSFNKTTNLTGDVLTTDPEKNGYNFGGYYTQKGGEGSPLINTSGNVQNVSGYTSSGKWVRATSDATTTVYAKWSQSVPLDKENGESNGSVTLTYNSASHTAITNPTKANYTFAGWYSGDDGTGQLIINTEGALQANKTDGVAYTGAGGIWTHTGSAPTLHAKWNEIPYTVTVNVGAGGGGTTNVSSVTDAKVVTGSSTITANPDNEGWKFKEWQLGEGVTIKTGSTTSASITVNATKNSSITAVFEPRFALLGSENDGSNTVSGTMPGWTPANALPFVVNDFTALGSGTGTGVDFRCAVTLLPNRDYKFQVYDRTRNAIIGTPAASAQVKIAADASQQLNSIDTYEGGLENLNHDVLISTVGYGTYTFRITYLTNDANLYPTVTIDRPTSYQSNFDTYYADGTGTLHQGTTGGTISVSSSQGGNTYPITNSGQWVCAGGSITYTASPATGYNFEGWYHSTAYNDRFNTELEWTDGSITKGSNSYAKFVPKTYTINLNGNGATTDASPSSVTATYNYNVLSASITAPKKNNYVFAGWYSGSGGTGNQVIDATGALKASVDGYTDVSGNWIKNTTPVTLYAKWIAIADLGDCWEGSTYNCGEIAGFATPQPATTASWSTVKWGGGTPTLETNVVIPSNMAMTVDVANAKAKEIVLSSGVTLAINPDAGLVIATTITKADGSATTPSDLAILSSSDGNGALITGGASTTTQAAVQFYSKARKASGYINQFIGVPLAEMTAYNGFYGTSIRVYNATYDKWELVGNNAAMYPFTAYNLMRQEESAGVLYMEGTLNLPGYEGTKTLNMGTRVGDYLFANSWTAPIDVAALEAGDFNNANATIYIFNAGTKDDYDTNGSDYENKKHDNPGQWLYMPVEAVYASPGDFSLTVIPSMQAFMVKSTAANATLTLDYAKHVYEPAKTSGPTIVPSRAPRREVSEAKPEIVRVRVEGESGYADDLLLFIGNEFNDGYDNGWEAYKVAGKTYTPQLYAVTEDGRKAISAQPDADNTVIGFKAGTEDDLYTFTLDYEGDNTTPLYLYDTQTEQYTRVEKDATYMFLTNDNEDHPRFVLTRYNAPQITTGVDDVQWEGTKARKLMIDGTLYIIRDGRIYNAEGALVK